MSLNDLLKISEIFKKASWAGSRLWARTKWLTQLSGQERKLRDRFLDESLDLLKSVEKARRLLLTKKVSNFPNAITFLTLLGKQWRNVWLVSLDNLNTLLNDSRKTTSDEDQTPKSLKTEEEHYQLVVEEIQEKLASLASLIKDKQITISDTLKKLFSDIFELLAVWSNLKNKSETFKLKELSQDIVSIYNQIIEEISKFLEKEELKEWLIKNKKAFYNFRLEKIARKGLVDWAKEKWTGINPNLLERQSLDIVELLNKFDELLENHLDLMESSDYGLSNLSDIFLKSGNLMLEILLKTLFLGQSIQLMMRRLPANQRKSDVYLSETDFREIRKTIEHIREVL